MTDPATAHSRSRALTFLSVLTLAAVGVAIFTILGPLRGDIDTASREDVARAEAISADNHRILQRLDEETAAIDRGVDAISDGYRCLLALLLTVPEQRVQASPEHIARLCGLPPAEVVRLTEALP